MRIFSDPLSRRKLIKCARCINYFSQINDRPLMGKNPQPSPPRAVLQALHCEELQGTLLLPPLATAPTSTTDTPEEAQDQTPRERPSSHRAGDVYTHLPPPRSAVPPPPRPPAHAASPQPTGEAARQEPSSGDGAEGGSLQARPQRGCPSSYCPAGATPAQPSPAFPRLEAAGGSSKGRGRSVPPAATGLRLLGGGAHAASCGGGLAPPRPPQGGPGAGRRAPAGREQLGLAAAVAGEPRTAPTALRLTCSPPPPHHPQTDSGGNQ